MEVFRADELSHLSAEVYIRIYGQAPVGGRINSAFVRLHRYINGASALMVLADALYCCHFLFANIFSVQFDSDLGGQLFSDFVQSYQLNGNDIGLYPSEIVFALNKHDRIFD